MSPSAITPIHRVYKIASIPGDGIGPEVISAGIDVLNTLARTYGTFSFEFTHFNWSSDVYKKTGRYIPEGGLNELKKYDAILFGAVGAPGIPSSDPSRPITHITNTDCQTCPIISHYGAFASQYANP